MVHDPARVVLQAARRAARASHTPMLLAVSGGLDSMALLVAMARVAPERVALVATLDHGTGPAASAASAHVARTATGLGLPVVVGRLGPLAKGADGWEAAWRLARHAFLVESAVPHGARIVTAHTEDDQVETVLMRTLRGAGARGLAGMEAESPIVRPWLRVRRAVLEGWLRREGVEWVEDPGNRSMAHLRNRVRHELLPALRAASPTLDDELLGIGRRAAAWRGEVDSLAGRLLSPQALGAAGLSVARAELAGYDRDSLAMLWGSVAARAGLALDRRGTHRIASFIMKGPRSGSIPLSGGWILEARPDAYLLGRAGGASAAPATLPATGTVEWGRFRFSAATGAEAGDWAAAFPAGAGLRVRSWSAGDRLLPAAGQPRRRVARYLSEAGVRGSDRAGWPVVVTNARGREDVVWIPGVRRSDAATERSGRPVRHYVCERIAP
ncbi:MAG: tRNA(Ile)-lysidine synthase [Gemmatimonadetes bacterium]|jgi:tRNA(Ile)-lysidine synthase|nr:tRNA(Ile)-lysidine synthase [Gemmatimonadota bacterium]